MVPINDYNGIEIIREWEDIDVQLSYANTNILASKSQIYIINSETSILNPSCDWSSLEDELQYYT